MKKLSLIAFSLALAVPAAAQYAPGKVSIGGSAQFVNHDAVSSNFFDSDYTQLVLAPKIGLSLQNGLMIGTTVIFALTEDGDNTSFGLSPFVRKNSAISDKAGAYIQLAPLFMHTSSPNDFSSRTYGIEGEGGVYYFISQKFSLELSLLGASFQYTSYRDPDGDEYDSGSDFILGYVMEGAEVSVLYHF